MNDALLFANANHGQDVSKYIKKPTNTEAKKDAPKVGKITDKQHNRMQAEIMKKLEAKANVGR